MYNLNRNFYWEAIYMTNLMDKDLRKELDLGRASILPERKDIPFQYQWKLTDIYKNEKLWEKDFRSVKNRISEILTFKGRLGEGSSTLFDCFKLREELAITFGKLIVYVHMRSHEDTSDSKYQGLVNKISTLSVEFSSEASYITPEILLIPAEKLKSYIQNPLLSEYSFELKELLRQRAHILSQKEEAILAKTGDIAGTSEKAFSMLTNADMKFPSIKDEEGKTVDMSEERAVSYLRSSKRSVRKAAFDSLYKPYIEMKNTLGATFDGMLKTSKFYAEVRKYSSPLHSALDDDNIPKTIYDNLVDTLESNLEPMHRYMTLRKKILRVKELHMYDLYTPLVADPYKDIAWSSAKKMMLEALEPLGKEYLNQVEIGLESGWVDIFANKGKRSGAYSWGSYATHPYIFMNYTNNMNDVSTLTHEVGHSMHSYYSRKNQPYSTASYCIFTAEVASTTNEILLLSNLIAKTKDKNKKIYLLNRRLESIRTTVYRQTMFASFEREVHSRAAKGGDTTADGLMQLWYELNRKYHGEEIVIDEALKMEWSRIPHFYTPFYVYQYATGFSAATELATLILEKGKTAREKYLHFLTLGGSDYPINLLKAAGVDMNSSKPVKTVINIFDETLNEMEKLLN